MNDSPLIISRSNIDPNGRIYIKDEIRNRMKLSKGEEVEVRYIEEYQGSKNSIIVIQKVRDR